MDTNKVADVEVLLEVFHNFCLAANIPIFLAEQRQVADAFKEGDFQVYLGLSDLISDGTDVILCECSNLF